MTTTKNTKPTTTALDAIDLAPSLGGGTETAPAPARKRTRKNRDADLVFVPGVGSVLPAEAPAAPAKVRRARKAIAEATSIAALEDALVDASAVLDAIAVKAERKATPNAERRNECPHPDAVEAVTTLGCTCGALPGVKCTNKAGKATNHVHANRMTGLDLARRYEATPAEDAPAAVKAPRKARTTKAGK